MQNEKELINKARAGDEKACNALMDEYKGLVIKIARKYFLINAEFTDLVQEGMLGLFNAYRDYNNDSQASFRTFASVCIRRQIQNALKKNNSQKNMPLNAYLSINNQGKVLLYSSSQAEDDDDDEQGFFLQADTLTPEESMLEQEKLEELSRKVDKKLSAFEKKVLKMFMDGDGYVKIAQKLGKEPKSIDNALSRIKNKLRKED